MDEEDWWKRFREWPLRNRLELVAFEAELAGIPRPILAALWEAIELSAPIRRPARDSEAVSL
jgi:hypothetical protein